MLRKQRAATRQASIKALEPLRPSFSLRQPSAPGGVESTFCLALSGQAHLARRDGDLRIPGDPPFALGLQALTLDLTATPITPSSSRLEAKLAAATAKMGRLDASGSAMLTGLTLDLSQLLRVKIAADVKNMIWLGLLTGDKREIDNLHSTPPGAECRSGGQWHTQGTIRGESLRVVRIDEGVRLIDGTLEARLEGCAPDC